MKRLIKLGIALMALQTMLIGCHDTAADIIGPENVPEVSQIISFVTEHLTKEKTDAIPVSADDLANLDLPDELDVIPDNTEDTVPSAMIIKPETFTKVTTFAAKAKPVLLNIVAKIPDIIDQTVTIFVKLEEQFQQEQIAKQQDKEYNKEKCDLEEVQLVQVIDGDTIRIIGSDNLEYKVRLIGIDTPESVHSDASKNNEFGTMASEHTKEMLKNVDTLYLEYDVLPTDKYNRVLAYVWFSSDASNISNMLNARILSDGYAMDKVYEPNHKYAKQFEAIRTRAMETNTGLWQYPEYYNLVMPD